MTKRLITVILLATLAITSWGEGKRLTLEDIYKNGTYAPSGITALRWSEDGKS